MYVGVKGYNLVYMYEKLYENTFSNFSSQRNFLYRSKVSETFSPTFTRWRSSSTKHVTHRFASILFASLISYTNIYQHKNMQFDNHNMLRKLQKAEIKNKSLQNQTRNFVLGK